MIRWLGILAAFTLAACTGGETSRLASSDIDLPPMRVFSEVRPAPPRVSNAVIARDFLDLVFQLESGRPLKVFSRFEGPVTVAVKGKTPPTLERDLDRLLDRLRREARIDIRRAKPGQAASIIVETVPISELQRVAPTAACIVRPNVTGWDDFRARRNDPDTLWPSLVERRQMAVFLPSDEAPQEIRDCLHEEIAQALGPVNDLFRLNNSIFNDDNFHSVLTGYDMLILRAYYDPELRTGMSQPEVARRLPGILARINPRGGQGGIAARPPAASDWTRTITSAMDKRTPKERRRLAAERAVSMAAVNGGTPSQLALSYYWLGRLSFATDPERALNAFLTARRLYAQSPDTGAQRAQVALQLAAFQLSIGRTGEAIRLVDENLSVTRRSENAVLLSLFLLVKAEALALDGKTGASARVHREALAWARYGFGSDAEVRERAAEILAISPRSRQTGGAV